MRPVPTSLESKLSQAFQTIHGNADPKMDIIAQKVQKYLTEGTFLQPRTIRTGDSLGPLDICIRREDVNSDPTEIVMAYIENGVAKVATLPYVHKPDENFTYQYTIGPAVDVACDFDGRWYRITERTGIYFDTSIIWALVTFGEPYIARVLPSGSLVVQQGNEPASSVTLAPDNVTKVSLLRGWKNTYLWNHDQGIICAYIRNGKVCYRNYAQQPPDQPALWENERTIAEFDTNVNPADNVSVFRTNDYRVGILAEINGQMKWLITSRNWALMAVESHTITAGIELTANLIELQHIDIYHKHDITAAIDLTLALLWGLPDNSFKSAENNGNFTITAYCEHGLINLSAADFEIRDTTAALFSVLSIQAGQEPCEIILTTDDLGFSIPGNLTLKFLGSGATKGEAGQDVDPFEITFTPTGIDYVEVDPPRVVSIWNE